MRHHTTFESDGEGDDRPDRRGQRGRGRGQHPGAGWGPGPRGFAGPEFFGGPDDLGGSPGPGRGEPGSRGEAMDDGGFRSGRGGRRGGPRGGFEGHGPHGGPHDGPRDRLRERRRGGRAQRGDVRAAVLILLAEQPMHGYQIMGAIGERTGGAWRPSAGAIYPTLAQLEDEGLVVTTQDGGRRLATLTEAGERHLADHGAELGDPFAAFADRSGGVDLRASLAEVQAAVRQLAVSGGAAQLEAAASILADTKRRLYLTLAGEASTEDD